MDNMIIADPGKVFLQNKNKIIYGNILILGNTIDDNGIIRRETEDDYSQIIKPEDYEFGDTYNE